MYDSLSLSLLIFFSVGQKTAHKYNSNKYYLQFDIFPLNQAAPVESTGILIQEG